MAYTPNGSQTATSVTPNPLSKYDVNLGLAGTRYDASTGTVAGLLQMFSIGVGKPLSMASELNMLLPVNNGRTFYKSSIVFASDEEKLPPNDKIRKLCNDYKDPPDWFKPSGPPKLASSCSECDKNGEIKPREKILCDNRMKTLRSSKEVQEILKRIPERCRKKITYNCECCDGTNGRASFRPGEGGVGGTMSFCWNNIKGDSNPNNTDGIKKLKGTLRHELTHALQTCVKQNWIPGGPGDVPCFFAYAMKIEAYMCGYGCDNLSEQDCLIRALASVCGKGNFCEFPNKQLNDSELNSLRAWFKKRNKNKDWCKDRTTVRRR